MLLPGRISPYFLPLYMLLFDVMQRVLHTFYFVFFLELLCVTIKAESPPDFLPSFLAARNPSNPAAELLVDVV